MHQPWKEVMQEWLKAQLKTFCSDGITQNPMKNSAITKKITISLTTV
jgi:hypothetical protein